MLGNPTIVGKRKNHEKSERVVDKTEERQTGKGRSVPGAGTLRTEKSRYLSKSWNGKRKGKGNKNRPGKILHG